MNSFFEKEYALRTNDFDSGNRILPSAILDLFQSAAGEHAELLDAGFEKLKEKNLAWVLTKVKFEILAFPLKNSAVKIRTWPLKNGRVTFEREYIIYDKEGNILIKGSSEWVTIDIQKRKISSPGKIYNLSDDEFTEDKNFEGKFYKVPSFKPENEGILITPGYTDFDLNGHVNNTKYADYILNSMPPEDNEKIRFMQIDYHLEVTGESPLLIHFIRNGNEALFLGENKNGQINFSSQIKWDAPL